MTLFINMGLQPEDVAEVMCAEGKDTADVLREMTTCFIDEHDRAAWLREVAERVQDFDEATQTAVHALLTDLAATIEGSR